MQEKRSHRKYKIISWPLLLLTFIPNFCVAYFYSDKHIFTIKNEIILKVVFNIDIWGNAFIIGMIITLVWSLIQCKLHGLWIGPLRLLINIFIPASLNGYIEGDALFSAGMLLFIAFIIWAVINDPKDDRWGKTKISGGYCIIDCGEKIPIFQISGDKWKGADGEIYTLRGGMAYDEYNRSYVVGYLDE